jgi:hypothetical protein
MVNISFKHKNKNDQQCRATFNGQNDIGPGAQKSTEQKTNNKKQW